jgi:hypothetical protein
MLELQACGTTPSFEDHSFLFCLFVLRQSLARSQTCDPPASAYQVEVHSWSCQSGQYHTHLRKKILAWVQRILGVVLLHHHGTDRVYFKKSSPNQAMAPPGCCSLVGRKLLPPLPIVGTCSGSQLVLIFTCWTLAFSNCILFLELLQQSIKTGGLKQQKFLKK